ncbi:DNA-formamidopyrimidine glycosylase family protein [Brevibacterium album]|uniref:DNA-formamidopyrimidine glycosylase family protein n=1 Tax=Brevibacterium album TaxID=417948 RepID=UPI000426B2BD|nr:DNA-formamidopyrimidine glycosylase family protein [Brevibacterium album]
MPELPEIEALAAFLRERITGDAIAGMQLAELSLLKTVDPPLEALLGLELTGASRAGKALVIEADGLSLVCRFARAGWLAWHAQMPAAPVRMGRGPLGLRVALASGAGFDVREAGTRKNASVALVRQLAEVPALAQAGPDALALSSADFAAALAGTRSRIKTVLEDQRVLAGIGNAWSDEILHRAGLSPFAPADGVDAESLHAVMRAVLTQACEALVGLPPDKIKAAKKRLLRVHGRTGSPCPVCGTQVAEVAFAERSLQYCSGCQTGGRKLSDRRMDRLLR